MLFLVQGREILGLAESLEGVTLPEGWQAIEGPNSDRELVYFDGQAIQPKPAKPSEQHRWDNQTHSWIVPELPPSSPQRDWVKLQNSFRGTPLMGRCFAAAGQDLACNAAFTILYGSITQTKNLDDLMWSLAQLRGAMEANPEIGDFTLEEVEAINTALTDAGFAPID